MAFLNLLSVYVTICIVSTRILGDTKCSRHRNMALMLPYIQLNAVAAGSAVRCAAMCERLIKPFCKGINVCDQKCTLVIADTSRLKPVFTNKCDYWQCRKVSGVGTNAANVPRSLTVDPRCPKNTFHFYEARDGKKSCYQAQAGNQISFQEARKKCNNQRATLIKIETEDEQLHLEKIIKDDPSLKLRGRFSVDASNEEEKFGIWTAAYRDAIYRWWWNAGKDKVEYTKWLPEAGWSQDRERLLVLINKDFYWYNARDESIHAYGYICEFRLDNRN